MYSTADPVLNPCCVFQFSSQKWLLPQLLTTQVLVVRGRFVSVGVAGSNQILHTNPAYHHVFINPALLTF